MRRKYLAGPELPAAGPDCDDDCRRLAFDQNSRPDFNRVIGIMLGLVDGGSKGLGVRRRGDLLSADPGLGIFLVEAGWPCETNPGGVLPQCADPFPEEFFPRGRPQAC